ncbi:MAG: hypothetical protein ABJA90_00300 [Ginsengibacter sp.]
MQLFPSKHQAYEGQYLVVFVPSWDIDNVCLNITPGVVYANLSINQKYKRNKECN